MRLRIVWKYMVKNSATNLCFIAHNVLPTKVTIYRHLQFDDYAIEEVCIAVQISFRLFIIYDLWFTMRHQRNRLIELNTGEGITRSNLLRSMLTNLIRYDRITTTNKKAKAVKAFADHFFAKIVGYGTESDGKRNAISYIKSIVWTEEEGKKALNILAPRYAWSNHVGGYTQMFKLGFRKGDTAEKVMIKLL